MAYQLHIQKIRLLEAMMAGNISEINYTAIGLLMNFTSGPESYNYNNEEMTRILEFQYYTWGVTGNIVSMLGLVGNALSITVLANRRMMSSTSCYLIALAIFDSIILISLVLFLALPTFYLARQMLESYFKAYPYMHPYAYPVALIAQTCSIYTTVAFTVERYIAVCRPLRAAKMCTISRARKSISIIIVFSILYNIPRMLEYEVKVEVDPETNLTNARYQPTKLGMDPTFRHIYFIYMQLIFMLIVPFTTLAVLNILLIRAVKKSQKTQGKINNKTRRENSLTVMLISVIVVFMICQVPSIVDNIFQAILDDAALMTSPFVKLTCISNLMVIMNSAINFYLYCVFGRKFRRVFCRIFCTCYLKYTNRTHLSNESATMQGQSFRYTQRNNKKAGPNNGNKAASISSLKTGTLDSIKKVFKRGGSGSKLQMSVYENGKTRSYCTPDPSSNNGKYQMVEDQTQL